jgi:hypothetical protein
MSLYGDLLWDLREKYFCYDLINRVLAEVVCDIVAIPLTIEELVNLIDVKLSEDSEWKESYAVISFENEDVFESDRVGDDEVPVLMLDMNLDLSVLVTKGEDCFWFYVTNVVPKPQVG